MTTITTDGTRTLNFYVTDIDSSIFDLLLGCAPEEYAIVDSIEGLEALGEGAVIGSVTHRTFRWRREGDRWISQKTGHDLARAIRSDLAQGAPFIVHDQGEAVVEPEFKVGDVVRMTNACWYNGGPSDFEGLVARFEGVSGDSYRLTPITQRPDVPDYMGPFFWPISQVDLVPHVPEEYTIVQGVAAIDSLGEGAELGYPDDAEPRWRRRADGRWQSLRRSHIAPPSASFGELPYRVFDEGAPVEPERESEPELGFKVGDRVVIAQGARFRVGDQELSTTLARSGPVRGVVQLATEDGDLLDESGDVKVVSEGGVSWASPEYITLDTVQAGDVVSTVAELKALPTGTVVVGVRSHSRFVKGPRYFTGVFNIGERRDGALTAEALLDDGEWSPHHGGFKVEFVPES